jgi:hypothetical protein
VFRHVALFRWKEGTSEAAVDGVEASLATLPARIPQLRAYRTQRDAGLVDGNWDFGVVADFDDVEGWRIYTADAEHQRIIAEQIRPIVAERAAVQLEREAAPPPTSPRPASPGSG